MTTTTAPTDTRQLDLHHHHYRAGNPEMVQLAHYGQCPGDCPHRHRTPEAAAKCAVDGRIVIEVRHAWRSQWQEVTQ